MGSTILDVVSLPLQPRSSSRPHTIPSSPFIPVTNTISATLRYSTLDQTVTHSLVSGVPREKVARVGRKVE
jgi:hypothetical protein